MDKQDFELWSAYITAQRKILAHISRPIEIRPARNTIKGKIFSAVAVSESKVDKVLDLAHQYLGLENSDIDLNQGFCSFSRSGYIPDQSRLDAFHSIVQNYSINFLPKPVFETIVRPQQDRYGAFLKALKENDLDDKIALNGKAMLTRVEIKVLDGIIADYSDVVSREDQMGAIFTLNPIGLTDRIRHDLTEKEFLTQFNIKADGSKNFHNVLFDNDDHHFTLKTSSFYSNIYRRIEAFYNCTLSHFQAIFFLSNDLNIGKLESQIDLWRESLELKPQTIVIEQRTQGTSCKLSFNPDSEDHLSDAFHSLFMLLLKFDKECRSGHAYARFKTEMPIYSNYSVDSRSFSKEFFQSFAKDVDRDIYDVNEFKGTIAFDFDSENSLDEKLSQFHEDQTYEITDFHDDHRFKVKIERNLSHLTDVQEQFQDLPEYQIAINERDNHVKIRKFQSSTTHTMDADRLNFLNEVESRLNQDDYSIERVSSYTNRYVFEFDEDLARQEEEQRYQKLRYADVDIKGTNLTGMVQAINYPEIRILLTNSSNEITKDDLAQINQLKPSLRGEIEKINRMEYALGELSGDKKNKTPLARFFFSSGHAKTFDGKILSERSTEWQDVIKHSFSKTLNHAQIRSIVSSVNAPELAVVQGPPGTGKSTAISEMIWHLLRINRNQRILLTSETHLAVDNALGKLKGIQNGLIKPLRFGEGLEVVTEDEEEESRIENEGARYSFNRMTSWATAKEGMLSEIGRDNNIQIWMQKIVDRSKKIIGNEHSDLHTLWQESLCQPNKSTRELFYENYIKNVNVVGATSSSIAERNGSFISEEGKEIFPKSGFFKEFQRAFGRQKLSFDVVITDEASKATPPELALPLLYGKKSVIIGDHRQLPPLLDKEDFINSLTVLGEDELVRYFKKYDVNQSHFEKLFNGLSEDSPLKSSYDTQYRMHSSINDVIQQFYLNDGGLKCGLDDELENSHDLNEVQSRFHAIDLDGVLSNDTHVAWVNVESPEILDGTSRVNFGEIDAINWTLSRIKRSHQFRNFIDFWDEKESETGKNQDDEKEIGIISFYGKQVGHIRAMVDENHADLNTRIKTVDRFQGMERNIIIVSLVRSDKISLYKDEPADYDLYPERGFQSQQSLGFAQLPNRLNVALSRAKRLLIVVGNMEHFGKNPLYDNVINAIGASVYGEIIYDHNELR